MTPQPELGEWSELRHTGTPGDRHVEELEPCIVEPRDGEQWTLGVDNRPWPKARFEPDLGEIRLQLADTAFALRTQQVFPKPRPSVADAVSFEIHEKGGVVVVVHRSVEEFGHDVRLYQPAWLVTKAAT